MVVFTQKKFSFRAPDLFIFKSGVDSTVSLDFTYSFVLVNNIPLSSITSSCTFRKLLFITLN